jgi:ribonuclease P/MRP protein subunit POP8
MSDTDIVDGDQSQTEVRDKYSETTFTLRRPPYTYLHLTCKQLSTNSTSQLDNVMARSYIHAALSQFLGLTGTAIETNPLKVEGKEIWLRVPTEASSAVVAAVSQWTSLTQGLSLQVKSKGTWLAAVVARGTTDDELWTMEK